MVVGRRSGDARVNGRVNGVWGFTSDSVGLSVSGREDADAVEGVVVSDYGVSSGSVSGVQVVELVDVQAGFDEEPRQRGCHGGDGDVGVVGDWNLYVFLSADPARVAGGGVLVDVSSPSIGLPLDVGQRDAVCGVVGEVLTWMT